MATAQKPAQQSGSTPVAQQQAGQSVSQSRQVQDNLEMPRQQSATQFTDWASI
jgi:hypothetical protein